MKSAVYRWIASVPVRGKLSLSHALLLVLVLAGGIAFLLAEHRVDIDREWASHTQDVLIGIETLRAQVQVQSAQLQGFRSSPDPESRQRYRDAAARTNAVVDRLRALISDNPDEQHRLDALGSSIDRWRREVAEPVLDQEAPDGRAAGAGTGAKRVAGIDDMLAVLDQMSAEEHGLLAKRERELRTSARLAMVLTLCMMGLGLVVGYFAVAVTHRMIGEPLWLFAGLVPRLSAGEEGVEVPHQERRDEIGAMAGALQQLKSFGRDQAQLAWIRSRAAEIAGALQHCDTDSLFGETLLRRLAEAIGAGYGIAYRWKEEVAVLQYCAAYGLPDPAAATRKFRLGEGLVGQCMVERRRLELHPVPEGFLRIASGLGSVLPHTILFVPLVARGETVAVLELGMLQVPAPRDRELLEQIVVTSALAWQALSRSLRTTELLAESVAQGRELRMSEEALRAQQEELRAANDTLRSRGEQLEEQGKRLRASEEELRAQAEELRVTNTALEEKSEALRGRQVDLEMARAELERKAEDLEQASRYKSEFLANMSHELRTPLNSMLILSKVLADNPDKNLNEEQVEAAQVVHDSGRSLLSLINDILDLSKVEAGKMQLTIETVEVSDALRALDRGFRPLASERGLRFTLTAAPDVPDTIRTDSTRLSQIVTNLLSNAFKFTHEGGVDVAVTRASLRGEPAVRIAVKDTGIGIPAEKLARVFQAFEQADSGTSRRYGGTGLGLSIVRGLTELLGGEVRVESKEREGSTFSVTVPEVMTPPRMPAAPAEPERAPARALPGSPVEPIRPVQIDPAGEPVLLIVEDDPVFARVLADIAERRNVPVMTAATGKEALDIAAKHRLVGVLLDLGLPDISGWEVLGRLKGADHTRAVPIHIISAADEMERGLAAGAMGFLVKPVTRDAVLDAVDSVSRAAGRRRLLLVDDDAGSRLAVKRLLENEDAEIVEAADAGEALKALEGGRFDCVILDLGLPDVSGFEFLERASQLPGMPPVVIYSGRELTPDENLRLRAYTESIVIKGARSPERLLDEVTLFLHALHKPKEGPPIPEPHAPLADVAGKTVLVVDDDMRNVFALSKALRTRGLVVLMAQDGHRALAQLESQPDIDIVLMDIMMPGMDGYETTRRIREKPRFRELPIIAVTAKAMKGDREKCIGAGANDYCSKPIDMEQLMSLIRVWV